MKLPRPEAFDILGVGVFGFFTFVSLRSIFFSTPLPEWMVYILLIVGVLGLIIDGSIVYKTYFKK